MGDKPLLASDIYEKYVSEYGDVYWPKDPRDRVALARVLYGRESICEFDAWFDHAIDLIEKVKQPRPPDRENNLDREDRYFRENLSTLTDEQKRVVRQLVRTTMLGGFFSMLVKLDRSSYGDYSLTLDPVETGLTVSIVPDVSNALHKEFYDWILSFSAFADEIIELQETESGWQFHLKEFYKE